MTSLRARVRRFRTSQLRDSVALRAFLEAAYGDEGPFTEEDWHHTIGGWHFALEEDGKWVSHAAVVERTLGFDGQLLRVGYVEGVATRPDRRREGNGAAVMSAASEFIAERFPLGALCTGSYAFYERLGWKRWRGRTLVRLAEGCRRTPEEDDTVMVLLTPGSPRVDLTGDISCDWRPGDVW